MLFRSDDFHHAAHTNLTGENGGYYEDFDSLTALAKVLRDGFFHDGTFSSFRGRTHGRPINKEVVDASQLVTCIQNHDQIGNRAAGDRLSASLSYPQLALASVLNLTSPFTPMIFMGEEFGASTPWQFFTSHPEPELGKATAEGRLREFERMGWDPDTVPNPQDPSTFANSKLDWSEAGQGDHSKLHALYRQVLALRRDRPDLTDPDLRNVSVDFDEVGRWLVLQRGDTAVVLNFADAPREIPVPFTASKVMLETVPGELYGDAVQLPAYGAAVLGAADGRI